MDSVNHPAHYGGEDNPYEAIKVIEAWQLDFCTGNAIKYISRAGKKDHTKEVEDLQKAVWYLKRKIKVLNEVLDGKDKAVKIIRDAGGNVSASGVITCVWRNKEVSDAIDFLITEFDYTLAKL